MHGRDFNGACQTGAGTTQGARGDHEAVAGQAHQARGPGIAAHHPRGKTVRAAIQPQARDQAASHAPNQAPVHVVAGNRAQQNGRVQRQGRWLVQAGRVAHGPFHKMLEQRHRQVTHQQGADGFVNTSVLTQRAHDADPRGPRHSPGQQHHQGAQAGGWWRNQVRQTRAGEPPQHQRTFAANHHQARTLRDRHAQGREHQRRGTLQGVLPREGIAKRALEQQDPGLGGRGATQPHETAKQQHRTGQRQDGQGDAFQSRRCL